MPCDHDSLMFWMKSVKWIALPVTAVCFSCASDISSTDAAAAMPDVDVPVSNPDAQVLCTPDNSTTYYADTDEDGFGTPDLIAVKCSTPNGFVDNALDCDDARADINPDGVEICDGTDNDCNADTVDVCPEFCTAQRRGDEFYVFCSELRSRLEAEMVCASQQMHLVRIDDADENTWIADQRVSVFGSRVLSWIGASDTVSENTWTWQTGEIFWQGQANGAPVDGLFSNWLGDEPNDGGEFTLGADCGIMQEGDQWRDRPCSELHVYICGNDAI